MHPSSICVVVCGGHLAYLCSWGEKFTECADGHGGYDSVNCLCTVRYMLYNARRCKATSALGCLLEPMSWTQSII